ncbi:oxidoreductase [Wenjunlia tyrosinilytica]|uniref:Oxidoreductase n=2 Tax=Wenjunlia tyrosinilytica TaxID=1544741 RepID=A0A917ZBK5_9ACTN|nr:oxidoreductase [Wenjunlia tyrosinilytica]
MATETVDGFRLDAGNHLVNAAFPEMLRTPGLGGLRLRPFAPGVLVRGVGRNYRVGDPRRPREAFSAARAPIGTPLDKARLGAALARLAAVPATRLLGRPETTIAEALCARGFSPRMVEGYLRPLLAALLSDPDLSTSSRCADLVLRGFARGRLCVPEGGPGAVPELMAEALPPGIVHVGERVTSVSTTEVTTAEHGSTSCRAVVVATDAHSAADLLPGLHLPRFHPVTTLHHAAGTPPLREPALVLAADRGGPVAYTMVASEIDPGCAPPGRALVSTTVLGDPSRFSPHEAGLDKLVRHHLCDLYGTDTAEWELLGVHHDPEAVPAMPAPHHIRRPVRLLGGLYVCGDHRDTGTTQGALHSGRRAAHHVLRDLGIRTEYGTSRDTLKAA